MRLATVLVLGMVSIALSAQPGMKSVEELLDPSRAGWSAVLEWKSSARNNVEVLPRDEARAREALFQTQVTTRSPMGAIIYETGGILVDGGWIRILGSGSQRLTRTLPAWNKGKTFSQYGDQPGYLLVADDAIGGFFAINGGSLDKDHLGTIYYLSPDSLKWESLSTPYSGFIQFCFSGDLGRFYEGLRWKQWSRDLTSLRPDQAFSIYPFLFTKEGKDVENTSRKPVPVEELWGLWEQFRKQFGIE